MKKTLLLMLFIVPAMLFAQQNADNGFDKPQRKVYLWDVTLSMKGAGGCPNIWNDVKEGLIKDIKSVTDPQMEIVILPFQHRILEKVSDYATAEGKQRLVDFVKNYDLPKMWNGSASNGSEAADGRGKTTMTKLYAPLRECLETVITSDKIDILVFFTDGRSDFPDDGNAFENFVRDEWCQIAVEKDIYAYYVMLTPQAANANLKADCDGNRFIPVDPKPNGGYDISTVFLTPAKEVCYNVKDDYGKDIVVKFSDKSSVPIEQGFVIHVESDPENPYFNINQDVVLDSEHKTISIRPELKMTSEEMRNHVFELEGNKDCLYLSFALGEGMDKKYNMVNVSNGKTRVELVGTDERTLKLEWK